MKVVSKVKVYEAPSKGMSAYETTYYTHKTGVEKIRMRLLARPQRLARGRVARDQQ